MSTSLPIYILQCNPDPGWMPQNGAIFQDKVFYKGNKQNRVIKNAHWLNMSSVLIKIIDSGTETHRGRRHVT